jgi:hypothetical protein
VRCRPSSFAGNAAEDPSGEVCAPGLVLIGGRCEVRPRWGWIMSSRVGPRVGNPRGFATESLWGYRVRRFKIVRFLFYKDLR